MTTQDPRDQAGGPAREDGATAGSAEPAEGAPSGASEPSTAHQPPDDRPAWLNGTGAAAGSAPLAPPGAAATEDRPAWWSAHSGGWGAQDAPARGSQDTQAQPFGGWAPDWSSSGASASGAVTRPFGERADGERADVPSWALPAPADPGTARPGGGVFRWLSLALAGLLLVAAGVIVGQVLDRERETPAAASGVPTGTAGPGPVQGAVDEPVAAVAEAVSPAVVQLEVEQQGRPSGLGSGVVYDSDGYILTAAHVVEGVSRVRVRLADGTRLEGRVLGADASSDVGVVKVERTGLRAAVLATGVRLRVGQLAVAIGSPFGLQETVTSGVVSAIGRSLPNADNTFRTVIQTDAAINSGNSGGALADRQGRVIGINSAIRTSGIGGGNVGIGFAVPIDIAARVAGQIVKGEPVRQTFLGVAGGDSPDDAGAVVTEVVPDSPAAAAGLRVGDRITKFDDVPIEGMDDLVTQVRIAAPGTTVTLTLVRDGRTMEVTVQLAERRD